MTCPCDQATDFPQALSEQDIPAGLDTLPRQIGGFPEFRRAMLTALTEHHALADWKARDEDDLGVMLLEMWAYICDILSFYDEVIANENYLRTAKLRPSLRKLTGLLGYLPRPAVAASVVMNTLMEGRKQITLTAGTAFRSEAFDDEAPQVFELDASTHVHPLNNAWKLSAQRPSVLASGSSYDYFLLQEENKKLQKKDHVLFYIGGSHSVHEVVKKSKITAEDDERYIQLDIEPTLSLSADAVIADIEIISPNHSVGLWTIGTSPSPIMNSSTELVLDGVYRQIKAGQKILVSKADEYRWFELTEVSSTMMDITTGGEYIVDNDDGDPVTLTVPVVQAPATTLTLDVSLNHSSRKAGGASNWSNSDAGELIVHYNMVRVGEWTSLKETEFDSESELVAAAVRDKRIETPQDAASPSNFILQDVNGNSVKGNGSLDYSSGDLNFQADEWEQALLPPVKVLGNVINASRGESVKDEVLGSGDASVTNQSFRLKKNPLTYLSTPSSDDERGVSTTLNVWVDGIQWQEVSSFYGCDENDEVYIVRQNDAEESEVIFGDGIRGKRLPSGLDNITASYRFGAGAAVPPANTINQLAKPIKNLTAVNNPFAATGGDDAEVPERIREYAPQSALLLGRAVSVQDFIAATAGMPGVSAVHAQWFWNNKRQRPVIQIWYIGTSDSSTLLTALRNLADPMMALDVDQADPVPLNLSFDVEVDEAYIEVDVITEITNTLLDDYEGMLSERNIGIGKPLFRSQLYAAILAIPGTVAVTNMQTGGLAFEDMGIKPENPGEYYDITSGELMINGEVQVYG